MMGYSINVATLMQTSLLTYTAHAPALRLRRGDASIDDIAGCACDLLQTCTSGGVSRYETRFDDAASVRCW